MKKGGLIFVNITGHLNSQKSDSINSISLSGRDKKPCRFPLFDYYKVKCEIERHKCISDFSVTRALER